MTPKDYFGLIVRIVGLLTFLFGLYGLLDVVVTVTLSLPYPNRLMNPAVPPTLVRSMIVGLVGQYLLRGAPLLVDAGYPSRLSQERSNEAVEQSASADATRRGLSAASRP